MNFYDVKLKLKRIRSRYELYLMLLLPIAYYIIFHYVPMYGVQIAFKDYDPIKGFLRSPWVGFEHFHDFFSSYYFWELIRNTLFLSLYTLVAGFPIPIFLALLISEIKNKTFKKIVQNITYVPHFISVVVVVGMLFIFLSPQYGIVNLAIQKLGGHAIDFMNKPGWFKTIFVASGVWQEMGWQSIIYIAALVGISPSLYEAAIIDGASRFRRIWHISLPGIRPTMVILFILQIGHFMQLGFEKILLMQTQLNMSSSDVIATFVYRNGIQQGHFSYSAAIGLFDAVINFTLLVSVNWIARRRSEVSLW